MATVQSHPQAPAHFAPLTLVDLAEMFGPMPRTRIRSQVCPATEEDCILAAEQGEHLCELVEGILVEKAMGLFESRLAGILYVLLENFLQKNDLGIAFPADAMMRLAAGLIRLPDVSFISWERLPGRRLPMEAVCQFPPDLAVEVISPSNTKQEMERKLRDYFDAGVRLVWYVDPPLRRVRVFTAVDQCEILEENAILRGGGVLPGFELSISEWFERAERQAGQTGPSTGERGASAP